MARIRVGSEELEFVSKNDGIIELEQGQEIPAAIFADELGRVKFRDRDSVSVFMSTLAALGGNVKQIDAAAGPPSGVLPPEVVVYIDLDTLRLYKRTESGWGTGLNLRGETGQQGQQGERGKTIIYGSENPNTRIDLDNYLVGDMYAETGPDNNPEHQLWAKTQPAFAESGSRLLQWERIGRPYGRIPEDGAPGQRGRSIFEGTSNPNTPVGLDVVEVASAIDGDLYIETDRFIVWKKIGGVWHERGQSFKGSNGQDGASGARGNSVYEGTLDPNSLEMQSELSNSLVGDVYINTATYVVWKKKRLTGVQWDASGTTFKGTDGTSGNTVFQGAGIPNLESTPKPAGFNNAKFGDVYLDTTTHKIWKYTSEDPETHWTTVGEPYRGVSIIQGKGDPNYLALLEIEPSNDLLYPDKQYDWYKVRSSNIGDAYFDVDGHDLWKKVIDIENYDETNPLLNKIWVKKGQSLTGPPAETLILESTSYFVGYDKEGKNPSPRSFTLTANLRNYPESGITYKFGTLTKDVSGNIVKTQVDEEEDVNSIDINLMDPETSGDDLTQFFGNPPVPKTYYVDVYVNDEFKASDTITVLGVREGSNAVNVILSNETHVFPSDTDGNINPDVYFLGATDVYAYVGAEILDPKTEVDYATSNNCFKVKIKSLNGIKASNQPTNSLDASIIVGQFLSNIESTGGGNSKLICFPFDWTSETKSASIVYEIYIKTSFAAGEIILEKTQSFARLNDGNRGRSSLQGTGDPNLISRTTDPFTKTSWGVYSNSAFGVPVVEAERDYEEVLSAVDGDKYIDLRTSLTYINSLKYENTKTVELTVSAPLLSLSLGHLRFSASGDQYVGDRSWPYPTAYTVTAISRNHVGTVYYEFLLGSTTLNNSMSNVLIRPIVPPLNTFNSIFGNNNSITYTVRTREGSPTGTVIASDTITLFGTKANSSNVIAHITNDSLTFPLNSDGVISSTEYSNASAISSIFVVEGNERLTPVSIETNLTNSTFKISFVSSNISISPTINSFEKRILVVPSNMTGDSASVTYTITAKNSTGQEYTFTKVQTFTTSKKAQSIISTWTQNQVGLLSNVEKKNQSAFSIYKSWVAKPISSLPLNMIFISLGIWGDDSNSDDVSESIASSSKNCTFRYRDVSNEELEDYYTLSTTSISNWTQIFYNDPEGVVASIELPIERLNDYPQEAIDSRYVTRLRVKLRRTPDIVVNHDSWVGRIEFLQGNQTSYQDLYGLTTSDQSLYLPDPTRGIENDWVVVEWDLSKLESWNNKLIRSIRITFFNEPDSSIDIEWITLGRADFYQTVPYSLIRTSDTTSPAGYVIPIDDVGYYASYENRMLVSRLKQSSLSDIAAPGVVKEQYTGIDFSDISVDLSNNISGVGSFGSKTVELGRGFDEHAYVDFSTVSSENDFNSRIIRYSGVNGGLDIVNKGNGGITLNQVGASDIVFRTNNAERMRIKTDGKIGVGKIEPAEILDVEGTISTAAIKVGTGVQWSIYKSPGLSGTPSNSLTFDYYGSDSDFDAGDGRAYIKPDSNVGDLVFTGQHRNKCDSSLKINDVKKGLIVVSSGAYDSLGEVDDVRDNITINESLPVISLSTKRNQKSVFGVISNNEEEGTNRTFSFGNFVVTSEKKSSEDKRLIINSVGEGAIWVTNINGNLENGDYITSCEIPGYGMRQESEALMNYTVAKITCDCDFNLNSQIYRCEEFEWEGKTYRKAFVGCTYHCG